MVYVDDAKNIYGYMIMSHMVADTEDELHAMADKIGLNRKWYQSKSSVPHYDLCQSKRRLAIKYGAKSITQVELIKMFKR